MGSDFDLDYDMGVYGGRTIRDLAKENANLRAQLADRDKAIAVLGAECGAWRDGHSREDNGQFINGRCGCGGCEIDRKITDATDANPICSAILKGAPGL